MTEIVPWTRTRPVWHLPIRTAFSPEKLVTAPEVENRICFDTIHPNLTKLPHLVWSGPFTSDNGNVSGGSVDQKVVELMLTLYGFSLKATDPWMDAILEDIRLTFTGQYFYDTPTGRLNSLIPGSERRNFSFLGTVASGVETPLVATQLNFIVGWQS